MIRKTIVMLALAVFLAATVAPEPAAADSDDLVYIIPAAAAGVVAVIVIIAILMADRAEPEFGLRADPRSPGGASPGVRFALDCPPTADGRPLVCW